MRGKAIYLITVFAALFLSCRSALPQTQDIVQYRLSYQPNSGQVRVVILLPEAIEKAELTIPRSAPGTYEMTDYAIFYKDVAGGLEDGLLVASEKGIGSYYTISSQEGKVKSVHYKVDIHRMESELYGSFASSKERPNYLGLLGYSVFGFVSGFEDYPIQLDIRTDTEWPIFSTLKPMLNPSKGNTTFKAPNFAQLADAQILMGNGLQLWSSETGQTPLFVAAYAETAIDMEEIGRRAKISLTGLNDYFGFTPMPHYTVCYEFLKPYSEKHDYGFSMEHLNSMTASLDTSAAITGYEENPRMGSMVHHIGHSWIPLRSYGEGYRPFNWQTAPIIETIWLNEGFTWFIAFHEVLGITRILDRFKRIMADAPAYIQEMSLKDLSILGSTQYSTDFRIGQNLFARGALMAAEMNTEILEKSRGKRSFKDAVIGLYNWSTKHQKAFEYDQILDIMYESSKTDLSEIWHKWQKAPANW